jgi:hypothetical protein
MGDGEQIIINLVINLVFGAITAAIANSKGRNAVGWFFLGFFFACIALIIILCISNLKEEQAKWSANEIEQRRLREQLRQEQLKNEALRQHTVARLDLHDEKLGIDTRSAAPVPSLGGPTLRISPLGAPPAVPPPGFPSHNWYTNEDGEQQGPYTFALLNTRARQGTLSSETLVWAEGMEEWQPAGTIPNLFPA